MVRQLIVSVTLAAAFAGPAVALDIETPADWLRRPSPEMLRGVWPAEAWRKGLEGEAVISCKVSLQGALFECKVLSESPEGSGFGSAAIDMTPQLLMQPARRNGQPVVSTVNIPLRFRSPGGFPRDGGDSFGARRVLPAAAAWIEAPAFSDVAAAYPEKARAAAVGGLVALQCNFAKDGRLAGCATVREEPKGYGFAGAARDLSKKFRADPGAAGDKPITSGTVHLPIVFAREMLTSAEPVVGKPHWTQLPTAATLAAAFPPTLRGFGTVRVRMSCLVQQTGTVSACQVMSEEPVARGVGDAALKLVPEFRVSTWTMEGLPTVGGRLEIPLRYESGDPAPATKP